MGARRVSPTELLAFAARWEGRISRDLLRVLMQIQTDTPLGPVEAALLRRDMDAAIEALGRDAVLSALRDAQRMAAPVWEAGWREALRTLPRSVLAEVAATVSFQGHLASRPFLRTAVEAADLTRIQGMAANTAEGLRQVIAEGLGRGTPPRKLAQEIRGLIGLNKRQVIALGRYRDSLVAEGRKDDQLERMVARRSRRMLNERARMIARTESMTALNESKRLQWQRLVDEGKIDPNLWEIRWVVAKDERLCPRCAPFAGVTTTIGGTFTSETETADNPPLHPQCRCGVVLQLKGVRERLLAKAGGLTIRERWARDGWGS